LPPHFLRQPRVRLLDAVVDVERGLIDVGAMSNVTWICATPLELEFELM